MKLFITLLITLAAVVALAALAAGDPGYVVFSAQGYTVRLPLLLFAVFILVGFILLYLLFNFIAALLRAPKRYRKWRTRSREASAQRHTMLGYAGLIEGDWKKAEESLLQKIEFNRVPLVNYLGAAYAAQQQGETGRRNAYLQEAAARHPKQQLAVGLTRARLALQSGETAEARDILELLHAATPKSTAVTRLLADTYGELGDWHSMTTLLAKLKRQKAYSPEELAVREQLAYEHLLNSPALLQGGAESKWKSLPAGQRKNPATVVVYARQLNRSGDAKAAEKILRQALNRGFDERLIACYGEVHSPFVPYQIELAESFMKKHGESANLKLCLARLYRYENRYELARDMYKAAIGEGADGEAMLDYATLLEQLGEVDAALHFFKRGISHTSAGINHMLADRPASALTGELVPLSGEGVEVVSADRRD